MAVMNDFLKRFVQRRGMSYYYTASNTLMLYVSREDGGWGD